MVRLNGKRLGLRVCLPDHGRPFFCTIALKLMNNPDKEGILVHDFQLLTYNDVLVKR